MRGGARIRARARAVLRAVAALAAIAFLLCAWLPVAGGIPGALRPSFLLAPPALLGAAGGIGPILLASLLLAGLAAVIAILLALPAGIGLWLARGRSGWGETLADMLIAVPSIVYGLAALALAGALGAGPSLILGALTLALIVLPWLARGVGEALAGLDPRWNLAAAALGLPLRVSLARVLWPQARGAIREAVLLAIGRAAGETAALLLALGSGFGDGISLLEPQRVLTVHITELALHVPGGRPQALASAAVLALAVLALEWPLLARGRRAP